MVAQRRAALVLSVAAGAAGHGMITFPPNRVGGDLKQACKWGDMDQIT